MSKTASRIDIATPEQLIAIVKRVNQLALTLTPNTVIPRTSPVFYALDKQTATAYWLSNSDSTHSKNIDQNPNVSVVFIVNAINGLSPASIPERGLNGKAEKIKSATELRHAYKLLKGKARTLPEKIEDFDKANPLRNIYRVRINPEDLESIQHSLDVTKYMVLGTSPVSTKHEEFPKTLLTPFECVDGSTIRIELNESTLAKYTGETHACVFDSNVRQGDGVGTYFHASVHANDDGSAKIRIKRDDSGNPVLTTNGLIEFENIRGWIDAQRATASNIISKAIQ